MMVARQQMWLRWIPRKREKSILEPHIKKTQVAALVSWLVELISLKGKLWDRHWAMATGDNEVSKNENLQTQPRFNFLFATLPFRGLSNMVDSQFAYRSRASIQLLETISGGPVFHCFVDVKFYSHLWANISAGSSESQETHAAARSCATIIITS